jgi:hypothetical protein
MKKSIVVIAVVLLTWSMHSVLGQSQALRLSAPGDFVRVPHSPSLSPSGITVEMFIKVREVSTNTPGGEQCLVDKRDYRNPIWSGYNLRLAGTKAPLGLVTNYATSADDPPPKGITEHFQGSISIDGTTWLQLMMAQR